MSLYPDGKDRFKRYVPGVDQCVASDANDAFASVVAIEDELGLDPSGLFGSIYSRLFATRNVSTASGWWRPLSWRVHATNNHRFNVHDFNVLGLGFSHAWKQGAMEGRETAFGDGVPACFGAYQGVQVAGTVGIEAHPWLAFLVSADEDHARWAAHYGQTPTPTPNPTDFGVLAWNLLT